MAQCCETILHGHKKPHAEISRHQLAQSGDGQGQPKVLPQCALAIYQHGLQHVQVSFYLFELALQSLVGQLDKSRCIALHRAGFHRHVHPNRFQKFFSRNHRSPYQFLTIKRRCFLYLVERKLGLCRVACQGSQIAFKPGRVVGRDLPRLERGAHQATDFDRGLNHIRRAQQHRTHQVVAGQVWVEHQAGAIGHGIEQVGQGARDTNHALVHHFRVGLDPR